MILLTCHYVIDIKYQSADQMLFDM